jgi:formyltetrahydrofolate deformylase
VTVNKSADLRSVLIIRCPDETGLVHKVTGVLFRRNRNIVGTQEFVDRDKKVFFMRTEFLGQEQLAEIQAEVLSALPKGSWVQTRPLMPKRIVVLATREPHCLGDLLLRNDYGELNAEILAVVSQYDSLGSLVEKFGVPFFHVPVKEGTEREVHEAEISKILKKFEWDYMVLAKYMRVLSSRFTESYENRIVNIHHSFLPAFVGARPYEQAFRRGVKIIGATAHIVNQNLDEGPIITQGVIPVDHSYGPQDMAQAGRDVERSVLGRALKLVFDDRVIVDSNRCIIFE